MNLNLTVKSLNIFNYWYKLNWFELIYQHVPDNLKSYLKSLRTKNTSHNFHFMIWVTFVLFTMKISFLAIHIQDIKPDHADKLVQRRNFPSTGVQPALNEYHFLPLHYYIIFHM